ncbi:MAG: hypothetical protein ACXWEY_14275, partial [Bacteroidia bacterium]
VEEITFQYLGYYGRFDVFAGSMDSGLGNILSFRYLDKPMSFELKLQYEQLMAMKDIFNKWEIACKKEIVVKNYLGIKSNI